jgi:tetratricopeptide (TPR) repeat protein
MSIGRNALYFDDYVLAIQYFNQVIAVKPYLYEPYMFRGIAKIQLGDFAGAEADCSQAIRLNPFVPQAYYARGFTRLQLDKFTEAEIDFNKALEFNPENQNLIRSRMYARAQNKDYDKAFADLDALEKLDPKNREWLYERGRLCFFNKDSAAAEQNLLQYVEKDSTNSSVWSMLALLKIQTNDTAALDYLNRAIAYGSDFSGDYINRGILNVRRLKYMTALEDYGYAIGLDGSTLAYYNRGLLRASLGDNNNAISDLNIVIQQDSLNYEARLRRALVFQTLRQYDSAIADFNIILKKYPYFVSAYRQMAIIYDARGDARNAFLAREKAYNIEKNREKIKNQLAQNTQSAENADGDDKEPAGDNVLSLAVQNVNKKRESFFSSNASQKIDNEKNKSENKYSDPLRGNVQDKYADIQLEKNFELNYYAKSDEIRRTPTYYIELDKFNKENKTTNDLKLTNRELPMTEAFIQTHFAQIEKLTKEIATHPTANLYFYRAIDFALVKDFTSAIEDLNRTLQIQPKFTLAAFERANIRYKILEISATQLLDTDAEHAMAQKQYQHDAELLLSDYDKVIADAPDFCFAYFNRANALCQTRNFAEAIDNYTHAITLEPNFAEAYFNRGIANLYLSNETQGLADLSKAGELGIAGAYNLIKRYNKQ